VSFRNASPCLFRSIICASEMSFRLGTDAEVSVVVPTHNRSALLAMTLRSVLRQQSVDLEVIVVDEASTDETSVMLAALGDTRVRVIRHDTPQWLAAARNHGAAEARGEWLAFIDDDDLYSRPADDMVEGRSIRHPPSQWRGLGNVDRLAKHGPPAWVCSPLIAKRVHPSNMSLDIEEIVRATKLIEAMHNTQADWGRLHRWLAERYLRSGQRGAALGELAKAATRGQLRGVTSDLTAILRRRLGHTVSKRAGDAASAADAWTAMATAWLREFEGCVQ